MTAMGSNKPMQSVTRQRDALQALCALPLLLSLGLMASAQAADEPASPPSAESDEDTWDPAQQRAKPWWERSRERAGDAWTHTTDRVGELWEDTQRATSGAWDSTRAYLQPGETDHFSGLWNQVLPRLEAALVLEDKHDSLPERAWLGEDQASNQEAISALLDEAVAILATSDVDQYRQRIRYLQARIAEARQDIAEDRQQRVSAPDKALVARTVEAIDRSIAQHEADIAGYEGELVELRRAFAADLRQLGLELADEQIELLLATVVGDNLIDLGIVFDNVKAITSQLERLVEDSGEDLQNARRYYGMYGVLLKALSRMHRQVEQAIAGRYIPQIDAIAGRAKALSEETRKLLDSAPDKAELLAANLEAQKLTLEAAGVYREYLLEQGRQVSAARAELERDIAAARNTYETVRVSGELVGLFKSGRHLLDGLLNRQVPALRTFQNLEMKREFEKLTAQLRTEEGA
jgi:hypothetical protein